MRPFISIVMPTFNRKDTLLHVLPSLVNQTYPADRFEILLSDSGSADGTAEAIAELGIPNLRLIVGENRGRSGARNRGIVDAKGDIVLFTDADIIAEPNLLDEHAKIHEADDNVAVVGREIQVNTLEEYEYVRAHPSDARHMHKKAQSELSWLFFLTGNASARREKLIEAGMFDEEFQGYGHEDLELGYRLAKAGVKIRHNAKAVNYHWHPVDIETKLKNSYLAGISTVRFARKHKDPLIKLQMGVNPFTLAMHALTPENGWFMRYCRARVGSSAFCKEMVVQYQYLKGVRAALRGEEK